MLAYVITLVIFGILAYIALSVACTYVSVLAATLFDLNEGQFCDIDDDPAIYWAGPFLLCYMGILIVFMRMRLLTNAIANKINKHGQALHAWKSKRRGK